MKQNDNSQTSRRAKLLLASYDKNMGGVSKLQHDIQYNLLPIIFSIETMNDLVFESLKLISPINIYVRRNVKSINNYTLKVLEYFGLNKKVAISKIGIKVSISKEESHYDLYQKWILGYDSLPLNHLNEIKPVVKTHLIEINRLIKKYEKEETIKKYLNQDDIVNTHTSRVVVAFYIRCLKERQVILDYFLTGVYSRATEKAKAKLLSMGLSDAFGYFKDFPYKYGRGILNKNFDYKNIDSVSHRLNHLPFNQVPQFANLYSANKDRFYRLYFKEFPTEQLFDKIYTNLKYIPLRNNRGFIFEELKRLFKRKKWLSFYALALPQVEGLFAEIVNLQTKKKLKSLSDKVKHIRSNNNTSGFLFDYFEYALPEQRNKFSHSGYVDDVKNKAYDLLTDLVFILDEFAELDNPIVHITRIIKQKNPKAFISAYGFSEYFELVNSLSKQLDKQKIKEIEDFNRGFLRSDCSIEKIIQKSAEELEKLLLNVVAQVMSDIFSDSSIKIGGLKPNQIKRIKKDEVLMPKISDYYDYNAMDINTISTLNVFFQKSIEYVFEKNIPVHLRIYIQKWESNKGVIYNLLELFKA